MLSYTANTDPISINTSHLNDNLNIITWKALRDRRVVKQNLDYSCGASSIATILTEYYKRPTTEKEVLNLLIKTAKKKGAASFADMQNILPSLGFKGLGLAASWTQLQALKIPVLIYVKQRKQDHFSVLSGIDKNYVKLSDPSLGNRILTRGQFKAIWETRKQKGLKGKILAIIPNGEIHPVKDNFFTQPIISSLPKELLIINR
jgi:predicted double-glycine peptidase